MVEVSVAIIVSLKQITMMLTDCNDVLIDFLFIVKAATLIFISGRGSAISSAKQGESGSIYNFVKS